MNHTEHAKRVRNKRQLVYNKKIKDYTKIAISRMFVLVHPNNLSIFCDTLCRSRYFCAAISSWGTSLLSELLSITRNLVTPERSKSKNLNSERSSDRRGPAAAVGFREGQLRKCRRHRRRQQCSQYIMRDVLLHFKLLHYCDERAGLASRCCRSPVNSNCVTL